MSAVVIILQTTHVEPHDEDCMTGREFQELRAALAALASSEPPRCRPCLVVNNDRKSR